MNALFKQPIQILFLLWWVSIVSCSNNNKTSEPRETVPVAVQIAVPIQHSEENITLSGQIEARETAVISTRVMGFVSGISVKTGDRVQRGQLLITINNSEILAKRAQAEAMISESEAALNDAQKDYERFDVLYKQQSISTKEFENAALRYRSLKARAEAAQQLKNEAIAMLEYTNLVAPFSGVIVQKNINVGSMASPGMSLLILEQTDDYQASAFVSENEVVQLKKGMSVWVTLKSNGKKIAGRISEISPSSQFTGGQFQIKLAISARENSEVLSGAYVNVSIPIKKDSTQKSLFVPVSAVVRRDQLFGLYTVSDSQTAQLRWIKIGVETDTEVEILSGLNVTEKIIAHSEGRLYSGAPVVVTNSNEITIAQ